MTSPARGGDTAGMRDVAREEIARIVYDRDSFAGDLHWSRTAPTERDRCRAIADAILALPVVQRLAVEKAAEERTDVWIDPARLSGEPCCGGTRVPVEVVIRAVWSHGVQTAIDNWCLTRAQVLHACWYAGAGNVVRLHGKDGAYVARRGPWRKRWGAWAKQVHGDLWKSDSEGVIPDPPSRADALAAAAQPGDGRTGA